MEKKYRADNGLGNVFWGIAGVALLGMLIYRIAQGGNVWPASIYLGFTLVFILSTSIKNFVITELNFLEIRPILKLFNKTRRIPIGDMVGLKKIKKNQLRIDKVRGFEVFKVKESDIDALIAELKDRNPRIIIAE